LGLFDGPAENAVSALNAGGGYALKYFLLSCVVEKVALNPSAMLSVAGCSLWARQVNAEFVVVYVP
jgi:hypothetical protein